MTGAPNSGNRQWPDVMMWVLVLALLLGFFLMLVTGKRDSNVRPTPTSGTGETTVIPSSPGVIDSNGNGNDISAPAAPTASQGLTQEEIEQQGNNAAVANPNSSTSTPSTATNSSGSSTSGNNTGTGTTTGTGNTGNEAQTGSIPSAPSSPPAAPIEPPVLPDNLTSTSGESSIAGEEPSTPPAAPASDSGKDSPPARPKVTTIPPSRSGGAVPVSQNRTPLRSDFRIMLGTFGSNNTLRGSTANVSNLGYTVHSIDVGDQLVAQVGPFSSEEVALQALQDIHRVYSGALLYRPKGYTEKVVKPEGRAPTPPPAPATNTARNTPPTRVNQAITTSANRPQSTPAATRQPPTPATNTPEPIATTPRTSTPVTRPASTAAMYLQVGAFEEEESAQRMVAKLRDTGFAPVVNAPEGRKVTVVVGPYGSQDLAQAEARLDQAGIDHFRFR